MLYKTGSPDTWHHLSPMVSVSRPDKILPECRVVRCQLSDTCATCLWSALCLLVTACALAAAGDVKVAFRNVSNEKKKTVEELIVKRKALNKQVLRFLVKKEHFYLDSCLSVMWCFFFPSENEDELVQVAAVVWCESEEQTCRSWRGWHAQPQPLQKRVNSSMKSSLLPLGVVVCCWTPGCWSPTF